LHANGGGLLGLTGPGVGQGLPCEVQAAVAPERWRQIPDRLLKYRGCLRVVTEGGQAPAALPVDVEVGPEYERKGPRSL